MTDGTSKAKQTTLKQASPQHETLKHRAQHELWRFAAIFAYLWAMFILFQIHEFVVLAQHGIPAEKFGAGFVNALIFAKVMVVADNLPANAWLRTKPLIVPIVARSVGFAALLIVVDSIEKILLGLIHHKAVNASLPTYGEGGVAGIVLVAIMMGYALAPFFAFEEIDRVIGPGRLGAILFGVAPRGAEGR